MTKQKVIAQLEDLKEYCNEMSKQWEGDAIALNVAIETLKNLSELEMLDKPIESEEA